jgi:hypothetical protein
MTCQRDMVVCVLYDTDASMTKFYTQQSMDRLRARWDKERISMEEYKVLFFLLLDKDIAFKEVVLQGLEEHGVLKMEQGKAERFLLALREEAIEPWLVNEELSKQHFLDSVARLYWSC